MSHSPLLAINTNVDDEASSSHEFNESVSFGDLRLEIPSNQMILVSRVKKAAGEICNKIYRGQAPMMKFQSRCPYYVYRSAKPQIDLAIANAGSGARVAINLIAKRGN